MTDKNRAKSLGGDARRKGWDFGRFIKTLNYFEIIPFWSCIQNLFQGRSQDNKKKS